LTWVRQQCSQYPHHIQQLLIVWLELLDLAEDESIPPVARSRALCASDFMRGPLDALAPTARDNALPF